MLLAVEDLAWLHCVWLLRSCLSFITAIFLHRMMGYGEEVGVTPRFCEELFARLPKDQNKEVSLLTSNELVLLIWWF